MILVDRKILKLLESGDLVIDPIDYGEQIKPASVDLRIGEDSKSFIESYNQSRSIFHKWDDRDIEWRTIYEDESHFIRPKSFGLFGTIETISMPNNLVGRLEGRSSIGRQGLFIHNAGYIDPGFSGNITLELFNATDHMIKIPYGTRICQIIFEECEEPEFTYDKLQSSKYMNQIGATLSQMEKEGKIYDSREIR